MSIARYPMNGLDGGLVPDVSGYGHHGTPTDVSFVAGKIGQAASFNGASSKVDTGARFAPTGNVTYMAWIKPDVLALTRRFLNQRGSTSGDFIFRILDATGAIDFLRFDGGSSYRRWGSTLTVAQGVWNHVAVVYDGTNNVTFVINGASQSIACIFSSFSAASENLIIGADNSGNYFDGAIDDVRICDEAVPVWKIQKIYNFGRGSEECEPGQPTIRPTIQRTVQPLIGV